MAQEVTVTPAREHLVVEVTDQEVTALVTAPQQVGFYLVVQDTVIIRTAFRAFKFTVTWLVDMTTEEFYRFKCINPCYIE